MTAYNVCPECEKYNLMENDDSSTENSNYEGVNGEFEPSTAAAKKTA
jgi:hypothetical protein